MPDEVVATLDDVVAALETINTTLGTLKTSIDAVKTEITTQANAINTNNSYIGSGGVVETNVDTNRVFVVAPWPPEAESEVGSDDTDPEETVGE